MTAAEGRSSHLKLACLQPVQWNALRCHHRQCHDSEGQLALVRGHQLRSTKGPPEWEGKAARSSDFGLSGVEQHTGKVCSLTAWATKVHGMGKQIEKLNSFYTEYVPDGSKEGSRENLFRAGHGGNGSRMGMEVLTLKGTLAFHTAGARSVQSLPRREKHYTFMKYLCQPSRSAVHHCFSHRLLLQRCSTSQRTTSHLEITQTLPPLYQK